MNAKNSSSPLCHSPLPGSLARAHDLLQISTISDLIFAADCPPWLEFALLRTPFVVVRRAKPVQNLIPVGVRGLARNQRFAGYLDPGSFLQRITPEQLIEVTPGPTTRTQHIPALISLAAIHPRLATFGLAWGPTGSVGFELATGLETVTSASDLDLLIRAPQRLPIKAAQQLNTIFSNHPCRIDVQLETPHGAISLTEYANNAGSILLRTPTGPILTHDPWFPQ